MDNTSKFFIAEKDGFLGTALLRVGPQSGYTGLAAWPGTAAELSDERALSLFFQAEKPEGVFLPCLTPLGAMEPAENLSRRLARAAMVMAEAHKAGVKKLVVLLNEDQGPGSFLGQLCMQYQSEGAHFFALFADGVYGSRDDAFGYEDYPRLVLSRLHQGKIRHEARVVIPGTMEEKRQFLFVDDLASAALHLMLHYDSGQPVYLKSDSTISLKDLAAEAAKAVGYSGEIHFEGPAAPYLPVVARAEKYSTISGGAKFDLPTGLGIHYIWLREVQMRLSALVIMRDAAADIASCLESVKGQADEIIVVDTGSKDDSVAIARRYTPQVYHFDWNDDFSAARNFALDKATGDWAVFLDSDEFFSMETRGRVKMILSRFWGADTDGVMITRRNIDSKREKIVMVDDQSERAFRIDPEMRYVDPIHEYLAFKDGHIKNDIAIDDHDLLIYHTGYSPERMEEKTQRNISMLEEQQRTHPDKLYLNYYLASLYFHTKDFKKGASYAKKSVEIGEEPNADAFAIYRVWSSSLRELGDEKGYREVIKKGLKAFPKMPDFYMEMGHLLSEEKKYAKALEYYEKGEKLEKEFKKNNPMEVNMVHDKLGLLYQEMSEAHRALGHKAKAEEYAAKQKEAAAAAPSTVKPA